MYPIVPVKTIEVAPLKLAKGNGEPKHGTHLAIEGDGFFQVQLPSGEVGYTRAGAFHVNGEGLLVTNDGYAVQPAITIPAGATSTSISKDGIVSVTVAGQSAAHHARQAHRDAAKRQDFYSARHRGPDGQIGRAHV